MNIWILNKHKHIKLLLLNLQKHLGNDHFQMVNSEYDDFFAIELVKPDQPEVRAYIYIYGQQHHYYGIHLEYPWLDENSIDDVLQDYEDLSIKKIITILASHFEVPTYADNYGAARIQ